MTRYRTHSRDEIVAIARGWIGTPYHHQASLKGVGTDCLGLVRGVFAELYGREAEAVPAYTRDWAEASGIETMLQAAQRHLLEIAPEGAGAGDVVVFRWRDRCPAKHSAILTDGETMIHACEGAPAAEVPYCAWWQRHLAGAFSFPGTVR